MTTLDWIFIVGTIAILAVYPVAWAYILILWRKSDKASKR